jgi:hypothetical protein
MKQLVIKRLFIKRLAILLTLSLAVASTFPAARADEPKMCSITLDRVQNGTLDINPPLPDNHQVPAGTELTLKATPASGYALDSVYHIGFGNEGRMH